MRIAITDAGRGRPDEPVRRAAVVPRGARPPAPTAAASCSRRTRPQPGAGRPRRHARGRCRTPTSATRCPGATVGVLDYNFGNFELDVPRPRRPCAAAACSRETTAQAEPLELAVATYNVENLAPDRPAGEVRPARRRPGAQPARRRTCWRWRRSRTTAARPTTGSVAADHDARQADRRRSRRPAARRTSAAQIDPVNDADGGQPGGNIRVGVPVPHRPRAVLRGPAGRRRHRGGRGHPVRGGTPQLTSSPGPDRPDQRGVGRQPQAAGRRVHAAAASRSSSSPTTSTPRAATSRCSAGSSRRSRSARRSGHEQATRGARRSWTRSCAADPRANVVVARRPQRLRVLPDRRHLTGDRLAGRPAADAAPGRAVHVRVRGQLAGPRPHPAVGAGVSLPPAAASAVLLRRGARQLRVRRPGSATTTRRSSGCSSFRSPARIRPGAAWRCRAGPRPYGRWRDRRLTAIVGLIHSPCLLRVVLAGYRAIASVVPKPART